MKRTAGAFALLLASLALAQLVAQPFNVPPPGPARNVVCSNCVALGAETTGGYAASTTEGGPATTATALAANGANCGAGQWAAGADAAGAAEGCTADDDAPDAGDFGALALTGDVTSSGLTTTVADDSHAHTATTLPAAAVPLVSFLTADATNATTTMAASGLTVTVTGGVKYRVVVTLLLSDSVAADGAKLDFDTGTAGVTDLRLHAFAQESSSGTTDLGMTTALGTDLVTGDCGTGRIDIVGSLEPSSTGTFLVRFAQNAHTTGTLTLFRGSSMQLTPMGVI